MRMSVGTSASAVPVFVSVTIKSLPERTKSAKAPRRAAAEAEVNWASHCDAGA